MNEPWENRHGGHSEEGEVAAQFPSIISHMRRFVKKQVHVFMCSTAVAKSAWRTEHQVHRSRQIGRVVARVWQSRNFCRSLPSSNQERQSGTLTFPNPCTCADSIASLEDGSDSTRRVGARRPRGEATAPLSIIPRNGVLPTCRRQPRKQGTPSRFSLPAASVGLPLLSRTAGNRVLCYNRVARNRREIGIPAQIQGWL